MRFSNPLLVTGEEDVGVTLTNKDGYSARVSVALPKQFPSASS